MEKITIVFNSGAIQEFIVESFSVTKSSLGELTGVSWVPLEGQKTPMRIKIDNVDAIFSEDLTEESA